MRATVAAESDNDWIMRAGTRWEDDKLVLPHEFLILPMTIASKAVVSYHSDDSLANRIAQALVIAVMVRSADTAFFTSIAKHLNTVHPKNRRCCHNCLRSQLFPNDLKRLRALVNRHIIHKVEDGTGVGPTLEHIPLAVAYYDEMFTLPLTNPIRWDANELLQLCQRCADRASA